MRLTILVARLYVDHDVSLRLAPLLRAAGHDVAAAQELGLAQATDDKQLLTAAQDGQVFLSHNRRDYVLLHDAWRRWPRAWGVTAPPHAGILVLDHRPEPELAAALDVVLAPLSRVPLTNRLYWWRYRGGWQHQEPGRHWVPYARLWPFRRRS